MFSTFLTLLLALPVSSTLTVPVAHAEEAPIYDLTSTTTVAAYVLMKDTQGGFNGEFYKTMKCESGFENIQSHAFYKSGKREDSWGIVQIHLPAHPDITKQQAMTPKWAIDWAAGQFSEGNQSMWSCWKNLFGSSVLHVPSVIK